MGAVSRAAGKGAYLWVRSFTPQARGINKHVDKNLNSNHSGNDNSHHSSHEANHRLSLRHLLHIAGLTLLGAPLARTAAQSATGLQSDATVLPLRAIRMGAFSSWTRFDELFGVTGNSNLAAGLATGTLGSKQLPSLAPSEADIRAASLLPSFQLNAGALTAVANARIVTAPVVVQYGLTSKLTLGVVVPLVESRTTLIAGLNQKLGSANVGLNPALGGNAQSALGQNAALVASLRAAADTLQRRLTFCQASPSNALCATINGQQAAATALIQTTSSFASALERLYGTDASSHPGDAFVPLASDPAQAAVGTEISTLGTQYQAFLNANVVTGSVTGAIAPAARDQLQALLAGFGHDSVQVADRSSIGDISVGATYQLFNSFGDTSAAALAGHHARVAMNGTFRIGTGQPANRNRFFDNGTGYGQSGIAGGAAADVQWGRRIVASAVGSYTHQLGTIDVNRVPNAANAVFPLGAGVAGTYSAGDVMTLALIPRIRLAGYFSVNGQYSIVYSAADKYALSAGVTGDTVTRAAPVAPYGVASATAQQVGFGFSYSTVMGPDRAPGRLPFEVSFSHLETIAGSGGPVAKTFRDQIELRVFFVR